MGNSDLTMDSPGSSFSEQKRASYMARMNYGLLQTYGRRVEKDVWSTENPNGKLEHIMLSCPHNDGNCLINNALYMSCLLYTSRCV